MSTWVPIGGYPELKRKGLELVILLLEDYKRKSGNNNATVCEMLPDGPVDCFGRYTDKLEKVVEEVSLRNQVSEDGSIFHRLHLYHYSRHVFHTEESEAVVQQSQFNIYPNTKEKTINTNNI